MGTRDKTLVQYRNAIRFFINDTPELNMLLGREESSDIKIDMAIMMTVDDWNISAPPGMNVDVSSFPSFELMIYGAVIHLLESAGILHSRNTINYNAGGLSVQLWGKQGDYMQWIRHFLNLYETKKMELIKKLNVASISGMSPYGVNTLYYYLQSFDIPLL